MVEQPVPGGPFFIKCPASLVLNLKDLADQHKNLLAVVVNSNYYAQRIPESTIKLKAELTESLLLTHKKFFLDLNHFKGDVEYKDGNIETFDNIRMKLKMPNSINGKFTGNKFEVKWDDIEDGFSSDSGHVWAIVIEQGDELRLSGFDFIQVIKNSENQSRKAYRLTGGGIPLSLLEDAGILLGRVEGYNIEGKSHLTGFVWQEDRYDDDHNLKDGSYWIKDVEFNAESYLEVNFTLPD